jgi:hexosaminidase
MKKTFLLPLLLLLIHTAQAQNNNLIPQPVSMTYTRGLGFRFTLATTIGGNNDEAQKVATYLAGQLSTPTGFKYKARKQGQVQLNLNRTPDTKIGDEGYTLEVSSTAVKINANKPAGLFYGVQTLLQLLPKEIESTKAVRAKWTVPACRITDYPRFGWRGMMLDVSRHFFSKADVERYIDRMARYKYNVFHWHLTDDEGWRIEIKSLPKLTQVGACRVPRYGKFGNYAPPKPGEPATDCGFYTQEDIREIVAYAAERHVQIMPEIDVPGHNMAAVASYPELCCTKDTSIKVTPGHKFAEWPDNGGFRMLVDNTLNPSDEAVYTFLDKVFTEIATLFPFPYIHTGGDECYHSYWTNDANCKALMQKQGLKNGNELQSYFTKRVEKIVQSKGKKMIGWDEILEGGLAPEASVMSWRGFEGGIDAAKQGHFVVMTPNDFVYTDLLQGDPIVEPDQTAYKRVRLNKAYEYEPVPEGVDPKFILGGEANLWTEKVLTIRQAEYMTYPRGWAIADILWSPKGTKNWDGFTKRMESHMERSEAAGCNYARSAFDPIVTATMKDGKLYAKVATEVNGLDLYYTINESLPDAYSSKYTQPVEIPDGTDLNFKVITYRDGKPIGKMIAVSREELKKRAAR